MNESGVFDMERLMTRVEQPMPYDDRIVESQFRLLIQELKQRLTRTILKARRGVRHDAELRRFARYVLSTSSDCVTFNYDDFLDEALWLVRGSIDTLNEPYWHPDGGYGFFCRHAQSSIEDMARVMDAPPMLLLKLHGSVNWRPRLGTGTPYRVEDVMHWERWLPLGRERDRVTKGKRLGYDRPVRASIGRHLEPEALLVPPVLAKASLLQEPILRLVWRRARQVLTDATRVVFIGYSLPDTDIGSRFLFAETLSGKPANAVTVISRERNSQARTRLMERYRQIVPELASNQFHWDGALSWIAKLPEVPMAPSAPDQTDARKWHHAVIDGRRFPSLREA